MMTLFLIWIVLVLLFLAAWGKVIRRNSAAPRAARTQ